MKLAIQLDLFKTAKDSEVDALIDEVNRLRKSLDKVRKGTYSRINIVEKKQAEILEEFEKWKKTICQEKNISYDFQCLNGHQSNLFDGIAMGL